MPQSAYLVDRCPRCSAWMPRATAAQHAVLQMVLEDVAMQQQWPPKSGRLIGPKKWWQLFISAFDRLQQAESTEGLDAAELLPAIDGQGFDGNGLDFVRGARLRRNLNSSEIGEVTEFVRAWAVEHGLKLREPKKKREAKKREEATA